MNKVESDILWRKEKKDSGVTTSERSRISTHSLFPVTLPFPCARIAKLKFELESELGDVDVPVGTYRTAAYVGVAVA